MYFTRNLKDRHQKVEVKLKSTCQIHRNLHGYVKDRHQKVEVKLKSTCQIHRNLHGYGHMNFEIA